MLVLGHMHQRKSIVAVGQLLKSLRPAEHILILTGHGQELMAPRRLDFNFLLTLLLLLTFPLDTRNTHILVNVLELEVLLMVSKRPSNPANLLLLRLVRSRLRYLVLHGRVHLGLDVQEQHWLLATNLLVTLHALVTAWVVRVVDSHRHHCVVVHLRVHYFIMLWWTLGVRVYLAHAVTWLLHVALGT